jgi:hypothetical protein
MSDLSRQENDQNRLTFGEARSIAAGHAIFLNVYYAGLSDGRGEAKVKMIFHNRPLLSLVQFRHFPGPKTRDRSFRGGSGNSDRRLSGNSAQMNARDAHIGSRNETYQKKSHYGIQDDSCFGGNQGREDPQFVRDAPSQMENVRIFLTRFFAYL